MNSCAGFSCGRPSYASASPSYLKGGFQARSCPLEMQVVLGVQKRWKCLGRRLEEDVTSIARSRWRGSSDYRLDGLVADVHWCAKGRRAMRLSVCGGARSPNYDCFSTRNPPWLRNSPFCKANVKVRKFGAIGLVLASATSVR